MSDFLPERCLVPPEGSTGLKSYTYNARDIGLLTSGEVLLLPTNTEIVEIESFSRNRIIQSTGQGVGREIALPQSEALKLQSEGFPNSYYPSLPVYKFWQSGKPYTSELADEIGGDTVELIDPLTGQEYECHYLNTRIRALGRNDNEPHHIEIWGAGNWIIINRILASDCRNIALEMDVRNFPRLAVPNLTMDQKAFEWYTKRVEVDKPEAA
ncbi:MAG: hypothetical protein ACXWLH_06575 [Candidatus Saccharimonadales bacterium]